MIKFVKKRFALFKNKQVRGEILSNIGLGLFVNALYSLTQKKFESYIAIDLFFAIILIVESAIMKGVKDE